MSNGKQDRVDVNIIINNDKLLPTDQELIFGDEAAMVLPGSATLLDVLVATKVFSSKGQARKTGFIYLEDEKLPAIITPLPTGFSEFLVGKVKHLITVWNPTE